MSRAMDLHDLHHDAEIWRVLQARAQALAARQVETGVEQGEEVLIFRLGNDTYSIPAQYIREVQPLLDWTPLPSTPSFVVGLVNIRGKILAALDVRPLLEIAHAAPGPDAFLIILHVQGVEVGLLADSVVEVRHGAMEVSQTLAALAGRSVPWVRGLDHALSLLIDPSQLLADPHVIVHDQAV